MTTRPRARVRGWPLSLNDEWPHHEAGFAIPLRSDHEDAATYPRWSWSGLAERDYSSNLEIVPDTPPTNVRPRNPPFVGASPRWRVKPSIQGVTAPPAAAHHRGQCCPRGRHENTNRSVPCAQLAPPDL